MVLHHSFKPQRLLAIHSSTQDLLEIIYLGQEKELNPGSRLNYPNISMAEDNLVSPRITKG